MHRSLRRRLLALAVLTPVLAVGVEAVIWLVAARQLEAGFQNWIATRRGEGWQIAAGPERLGGWPFSATVTVSGFAISGGQNLVPDGLAWRAHRLALSFDLLAPNKLFLRSAGTEHFRIAGSPEIALAARQIRAVLLPMSAGPGEPNQIDITAEGVHLGASSLDPDLIQAGNLAIGATFEQPAGDASEVATDTGTGTSPGAAMMTRPEVALRLQATGVTIARAKLPALGPDIALISLSATMSGPLPSGPAWAVGLGAWRDGGGMLIVRDFSVVWGPLAIGAAGRLALDQAMQPAGEGTARVVGYAATLDAMVADGSIGRSAATAAKAVLMLLARPSNTAGAPPEVDVPLRLEDRTLSIGIIPLLRLPVLSWPGGSR